MKKLESYIRKLPISNEHKIILIATVIRLKKEFPVEGIEDLIQQIIVVLVKSEKTGINIDIEQVISACVNSFKAGYEKHQQEIGNFDELRRTGREVGLFSGDEEDVILWGLSRLDDASRGIILEVKFKSGIPDEETLYEYTSAIAKLCGIISSRDPEAASYVYNHLIKPQQEHVAIDPKHI